MIPISYNHFILYADDQAFIANAEGEINCNLQHFYEIPKTLFVKY